MVNLRELKLKGKTICDCGHSFTANDIKALIKNTDYRYYGGRVEYYSVTTCPDCGKEIVILLEPYNGTYRVINIAEIKEEKECIVEETATTEAQPIEQEQNVIAETETAETAEQEEKQAKAEIVCTNCGKTFKSLSGLRSHEKKCLNKE